MIFNTDNNASAISLDAVSESPYALGLEGALMHVYENECNFNAIMKAVGVSELKYFRENGQDLFVNEAGATGGFFAKARDFFLKVIEKIKMMFKKFMATINSFVMKDKDFVKKYRDSILRVTDLTDFNFKGYKFGDLSSTAMDKVNTAVKKDTEFNTATITGDSKDYKDQDELNSAIEKLRGKAVGENNMELTTNELSEKLKELFYGDGKEELENISLRTQLDIISNASSDIKTATNTQKTTEDTIKKYVKACEDAYKLESDKKASTMTDSEVEKSNIRLKNLNDAVTLAKEGSQILTTAYGVYIGALKDRNRQAKAICVKALGYKPKNESASLLDDDIFAGVSIR